MESVIVVVTNGFADSPLFVTLLVDAFSVLAS